MKRTLALSLGAAILGTASAGLITATPAAAANYTRFDQVKCFNEKHTHSTWTAKCRVPYGHARANAECADGTEHFGAWVGRGKWIFKMNCYGSRLGAIDVQTRKN
ncbi:hypothetical protein [Streptomyces sp. NPDC048611]|uniref:hypothetical protein n=1 Tax=unclassified Streptomyces TaxID=2593676 RepID=UPI00344A4634